MRLNPNEARIVNQLRSLRKGRITIDKRENGEMAVDTHQRLEAPRKEAQGHEGSRYRNLRD